MFIRKANPFDINQILTISRACELGTWNESELETEFSRIDALVLAATNEGEDSILGFISGRFTALEDNTEELAKYSEADVINLGVLETHRKLGIGSALLKKFISQAKEGEVKTIWLEVRELNLNARKFYEQNGFRKMQTRKNFYTNPVDNAIVMKFDV